MKAYTTSDGSTWTTTQMSGTWAGNTFGISFDPALDYDLNGNYYFVFGGAPLSGNYPNSIAVAKATPDGLGWRPPVAVTFNPSKFFDDKYWIAVDRSPSRFQGRVYVSWDRNTATDQILYIVSSSDGGATWSAPVKADDGTSRFERVICATPAVDTSSTPTRSRGAASTSCTRARPTGAPRGPRRCGSTTTRARRTSIIRRSV